MAGKSKIDRYPDWFEITVNQTAINTDVITSAPLPILRTRIEQNKAWVVELLWTVMYSTFHHQPEVTNDSLWYVAFDTKVPLNPPLPTLASMIGNPNIFTDIWFSGQEGAASPTPSSVGGWPYIAASGKHNYQSEDGYGMIIASDQLWVFCHSAGLTDVGQSKIRFYYRLQQVPVTEFIGIVQSQVQRGG
jgi:hypothetical protein